MQAINEPRHPWVFLLLRLVAFLFLFVCYGDWGLFLLAWKGLNDSSGLSVQHSPWSEDEMNDLIGEHIMSCQVPVQ